MGRNRLVWVLAVVPVALMICASDAWAAVKCIKPLKQPIFCVDSGGCSDHVELVSCPRWGTFQEAQRCSAGWDTQTLNCCGTIYNNVPKIVNCQALDARLHGRAAPALASCAEPTKAQREAARAPRASVSRTAAGAVR